MTAMTDKSDDSRMWLEIVSCEEDWEEFLDICGREFTHSVFARRYLPDVEKRKQLMPEYFKYLYESIYSNNRSILICLKTNRENGKQLGKSKIIIGWIYRCDFAKKTVDASKLFEIYKEGTQILFERNIWIENQIHQPMQKAAQDLGMKCIYTGRQAIRRVYKQKGIMTEYTTKAGVVLGAELKRRWNLKDHEFLFYWLIIDSLSGARKLITSWGLTEIAHLHYNFRPGLKCCDDPTAKEESEVSCHFVYVMDYNSDSVKKYFQHRSFL